MHVFLSFVPVWKHSGAGCERKMNRKEEIFLGEIRQHVSPDAGNQRPRKKRNRILRALGVGGTGLSLWKGLLIFGVSAALISTIIGTYIVSQTDDITLVGRLSYDLFIDDVPMGSDDYVMPPDTFEGDNLTWGETESFYHEFWSPPANGNFSVVIDYSWETWLTNPEHEFYGYIFQCYNETGAPVNEFQVFSGEPARVIEFRHSLDVHFAHTPNPLPYALVLEVDEYNAPPLAHAYNVDLNEGGQIDINASLLATDAEGDMMTVSWTGTPTGDSHISVSISATNELHIQTTAGFIGPSYVTFKVTDGFSESNIATVTVS